LDAFDAATSSRVMRFGDARPPEVEAPPEAHAATAQKIPRTIIMLARLFIFPRWLSWL
jgi:hypothetical protein